MRRDELGAPASPCGPTIIGPLIPLGKPVGSSRRYGRIRGKCECQYLPGWFGPRGRPAGTPGRFTQAARMESCACRPGIHRHDGPVGIGVKHPIVGLTTGVSYGQCWVALLTSVAPLDDLSGEGNHLMQANCITSPRDYSRGQPLCPRTGSRTERVKFDLSHQRTATCFAYLLQPSNRS